MINVLLTGAGFTANFGAPVAADIYNILFNENVIQRNVEMRKLFLSRENIKDSNYEGIYEEIDQSERADFEKLLWDVFSRNIDLYAKRPSWRPFNQGKSQEKLLHRFLVKLCYSDSKSIFFTLNQDLFIERQFFKLFPGYSIENVHIDGVLREMLIEKTPDRVMERLAVSDEIINRQNSEIIDDLRLDISSNLDVLARDLFDKWYSNVTKTMYYVKLHGSLDFFRVDAPVLITGINKGDRENPPLIQCYIDFFERILKENDCKLFIIGYGFKDKHINSKIRFFLDKASTLDELYLVDCQSMDAFLEALNDDEVPKDKLLAKLKGYYPNGLDSYALCELLGHISV